MDTASMANLSINDVEAKPIEVIYEKADIVCVPLATGEDMILIPGKDVTLCQKEKVKEYVLVPFNPLEGLKNGYIRLGKAETLSVVKPTLVEKQDGLTFTDYKDLKAGYYILFNKEEGKIIPLWVRAADN